MDEFTADDDRELRVVVSSYYQQAGSHIATGVGWGK
jgi:hypothetical protein